MTQIVARLWDSYERQVLPRDAMAEDIDKELPDFLVSVIAGNN